jgi:hypothetical protein
MEVVKRDEDIRLFFVFSLIVDLSFLSRSFELSYMMKSPPHTHMIKFTLKSISHFIKLSENKTKTWKVIREDERNKK